MPVAASADSVKANELAKTATSSEDFKNFILIFLWLVSRIKQKQIVTRYGLYSHNQVIEIVESYGVSTFGEQDLGLLVDELVNKMDLVEGGDLHLCEDMLVCQANALQAIFVNLARRAINQEYLKQYESYLRLALKAQNQSRMTLETLAAIKNPPVVFARQANINQGNGNQQVNNGTPAPASHADKNVNQPNELLEVQHGERVDDGTAAAAIRANQFVEAMG
jgi:hypothetical protein